MEFTRGNLALRDHVSAGKRVFLFEQTRKGYVSFVSEVNYFDCDYYPTHDTNGDSRQGIKFFFKRVGSTVGYELPKVDDEEVAYGDLIITERAGIVISRVGQGAYRKSIINRWENRCAVTGFADGRILVASHISYPSLEGCVRRRTPRPKQRNPVITDV